MVEKIPTAFHHKGIHIPVEQLLPTKKVATDVDQNSAYRRILSSIREVRLIEPIIVFPQGTGKNIQYTILDGHLRFEAMKALGYKTIPCLIATEDETYTYNHKVNVIPPIQEHFMILKAVQSGVSEERIAAALSVDVSTIRAKRDLVKGVCPEAVELLKNKPVFQNCMKELRKVKPLRQIEMAELMVGSSNYSTSYAKCLLAATVEDQLVDPEKPKAPKAMKVEEISAMEREMESLDQNFLALQESHGKNVLNLVMTTAWLRKLIENAAIAKFLMNRHGDMYSEFQKLVETASLQRNA